MKNDDELESYNIGEVKSSQKIVSKEMVFLFVSLAVSLIIFFVFSFPEYKKMKVMELEIGLIKDNINYRENTAKKIKNFNEKYKDVKTKDIDKISSLLSDRNNFEEHLANINNSARANGILIDDFLVAESTESDSVFKTVEVNFSAKGVFSNFFLFLDSLEKSIPLTDLNKLKIKKNEIEDEKIVKTETETKIEEGMEEGIEIENVPIVLEYDITLSFYYL